MNGHDALDDDARERAALHALGCLATEEATSYETHLAGCEPCREEVRVLRRVAAELVLAAPRATPPDSLKNRLMARVRVTPQAGPRPVPEALSGQTWKSWRDDAIVAPPSTVVTRDATSWERTAFEGVEARRLFVDAANDRVTMLVRMAPGSAYPAHVHGGPEECFVLEGDIDVGGLRMIAGDYQRVERGQPHAVQSTRDGCLLFIVSSLHDELLTA